jgi:DNA-binding transcriptional ArsR family regulator
LAVKKSVFFEEDGCRVRVVHLEKVELARKNAIPDSDIERLALLYGALGDASRLKIVMVLKSVEMCVCDLAAFLGLTESAVSHQLRRLREMNLVKKRRVGQVIYYRLDDEHVAGLLNVGLDHIHE